MQEPPGAIQIGLLWLVLASVGCSNLGPNTVVRDRLAYNGAIATSSQEQTLLNLVRMRYLDAPVFLDVAQIVSGYQVEQSATATAGAASPLFPNSLFGDRLFGNVLFGARYTDRPTISYTPLTKAEFVRNLTTPIAPSAVLFLIQAGNPADLVLTLTVDSINGLRNQSVAGMQGRPADPEFARVLELLRKAQISGAVAMRVERHKDSDTTVLLIRDDHIEPELATELLELRHLLQIDDSEREIKVVFGARSTNPKELAIQSRSALRVFSELSAYVQVPEADLIKGSTPDLGLTPDANAPLTVRSGCKKPCDAFVSVSYRGQWFWIDDSDPLSKRTLLYLSIILALADTGTSQNLPLVTIPAN